MQIEKTKLVELKEVSFSYQSEKVLDNISLEVEKGDFLGLIGPNGSGKSTLLRIILGLLTPSEGSVFLFGQDQKKFRDWAKIGYVPQKMTQFESKFPVSVEEVVMQGRIPRVGLFRMLSKNDFEKINHALEIVDMKKYRKRLISELSGGQKQRVFIARALAQEPELLLLDEPTTGVDTEAQDAFYKLLTRLNKKDKLTLILVSHDIDVVVNEVNKIACINRRLVYHGTPKQFIKDDYIEKLYGKTRKFVLHKH